MNNLTALNKETYFPLKYGINEKNYVQYGWLLNIVIRILKI
jgi:hypothetical protein